MMVCKFLALSDVEFSLLFFLRPFQADCADPPSSRAIWLHMFRYGLVYLFFSLRTDGEAERKGLSDFLEEQLGYIYRSQNPTL